MRYLTEIIKLNFKYEFIKTNETEVEKEIKEKVVNYIDSVYADCLNIRSFIFNYIYFL